MFCRSSLISSHLIELIFYCYVYARVIDSLMYFMNCTKLDITYSVDRLNKYTSNPNREYWGALI